MIFLISICDFPWWLYWLLPFLLGLGLGWALWAKYKSQIAGLEATISSLNNKIKGLESNLAECRSKTADFDGEIALAKGRVREMEEEVSSLKASIAAGGSPSGSGVDLASSFAAGAAGSATSSMAFAGGGDDSGKYAKLKTNNLQIIEGIGPKMEEVLKENGIDSWSELAAKSPEELRAILNKYGDSYKIIDPSSWSAQAKMAADGDFNGLVLLQKDLDGGVATGTSSDSKLEKLMIKLGIIKSYKQDDLKIVEGIGPKIEELLHNAGIKTWKALSETSSTSIKEILTAAGPNFQLADPETWPKQAELADAGKWAELEEYQSFLQGGKG